MGKYVDLNGVRTIWGKVKDRMKTEIANVLSSKLFGDGKYSYADVVGTCSPGGDSSLSYGSQEGAITKIYFNLKGSLSPDHLISGGNWPHTIGMFFAPPLYVDYAAGYPDFVATKGNLKASGIVVRCDNATTTTAGLMSAADKKKLDNIGMKLYTADRNGVVYVRGIDGPCIISAEDDAEVSSILVLCDSREWGLNYLRFDNNADKDSIVFEFEDSTSTVIVRGCLEVRVYNIFNPVT